MNQQLTTDLSAADNGLGAMEPFAAAPADRLAALGAVSFDQASLTVGVDTTVSVI